MTEQEEILWALEDAGRPYNEWILSRTLPFVGASVLEVGAGIGTFTIPLAGHAGHVTAVEPDPAIAAILEQRIHAFENVSSSRADALDLSPELLGRRFHSAVCFNVLEHISDDAAALARIRTCLRPRGQIFVLSPAHAFLFGATDLAVDHERRYTTHELGSTLRTAGFSVVELKYVNPIGALGWLVSSRVLRRRTLSRNGLKIFSGLVPMLRLLDRVPLRFGLSVWARARAI